MKLPVEVSARHIHLSEKDFEKLFGKGETLIPLKKLSQPGEFASDKTVKLINKDKEIANVRVLGPFRKNSQAEISMTDAYSLKLFPLPKIRVSGDLADTIEILAKSKKGSVKIPCIIAKRHLHLSEKEAKTLKLKNNQKVSVRISGERGVIFNEITTRVSEKFRAAVHLDTDEGNAAGISGKTSGQLVK
jgi:propanediol utilization protein